MRRATGILLALALALGQVSASRAAAQEAAREAQPAPLELDLRACIDQAVHNNLAVRLAEAGTGAARGRILQSASSLLPRLTGSMSQTRIFKEDLPAMGFSGGGFPELLGPWNDFEARVRLVAEVFDLPSILRLKSANADDRAAAMETSLATEQVAGATALAYMELFRSRQAIASAAADVKLAASLRELAEDKKKAGTAAGIDVARARTREEEEKLALLEARTVAQEAEVRLLRVTVLPLGKSIVLKEEPAFAPAETPRPEEALQAALAGRWEMRIADERIAAAQAQWRAERSERLPSVALTGDVGLSGPDPDSRARTTGSAGAALRIPIFTGRAIEGRVREADSRRAAAEARLASMRAQVEEDVRLAVISLGAAIERVDTAAEVARLAEDELSMARDRFAAGVADNVELLNSQTAVSHARNAQVSALARYQVARISLAMAMGRMRDFKF